MDVNSIEIQIFVSCPKDVNSEKQAVKEVCESVNKTLMKMNCNIHLVFRDFSEVIGHTGKRPQQIINDAIVGYDIYLGILHMRFGTPTGATNLSTKLQFESGTEEEYEVACQKQKAGENPQTIFFFFKEQIGSKTKADHEQAGKVLEFRERLIEEQNWVNDFSTTSQFYRTVFELLMGIAGKLCVESKTEMKEAVLEGRHEIQVTYPEPMVASLVPKFQELEYYIPRSITLFNSKDLQEQHFFLKEKAETILLRDIVLETRKIVLLGNAGSGKSIELQQTAKYFQQKNTAFIPVYKRFNTYINEDIENFLPEGWQQVNKEIALVLLDGLDEIQPQYFNEAIKKIIRFSEQYPDIRMIISCRTNFYDLPTQTFSGTLTGFQVYVLKDISLHEIRNYITNLFNLDGQLFIEEAYRHSFLDLVQKPFFLNILLKHYAQHKTFAAGRAEIIEEFILSMIELDREHFKTTTDPKSKKEILHLLQKLAFVMEFAGCNFITDEEFEQVLDAEEREQVKMFSAFSRNTAKGQWMFEHNNIQEFLASQVLARQNFENLVKIISFQPSYTKVKPTWVNTISFFISVGEPKLRSQLIDWLLDKEPEIIVKFERDRVPKEVRLQIFKDIFGFYKEKNIWLNSNKFNDDEISRFILSSEAIEFLIGEIENKYNTNIVRLNALTILDNFDLLGFDLSYKERIKKLLLSILDEEDPEDHMIYSILYAMAKLDITDAYTVHHVVELYGKRKNQYIRAGLYKLINASNFIDQHIDVYVDGLLLSEMEDAVEDRKDVNLADEDWLLQLGIEQIKTPSGLRKILELFGDPDDRRKLDIYNKKDVFEKLIDNVLHAYGHDHSLIDVIYEIYKTAGRTYDRFYADMLIPFFKQTGNLWQIFKRLWKDNSDIEYYRGFLLESLLDETIVENFIREFKNREFTNDDLVKFHGLIAWYFNPTHKDYELVERLENGVKGLTDIKLERPRFVDWSAINKKRAQQSFDLLFDKEAMLAEVQAIFKEIGKDNVVFEDLWQLRKDQRKDLEDHYIHSAIELVRDFTTHKRQVSFDRIKEWTGDDTVYDNYMINEIHQDLQQEKQKGIIVSEQQKQFIIRWSERAANESDIKHAIYRKGEDGATISVDWKVRLLWFFINRFDIQLPENKFLDFTWYHDFDKHSDDTQLSVLDKLETFVSKEKIEQRVIQNLAEGIPVIYVWTGNAVYTISKNLKKAFPSILSDLKNPTKAENYRITVLDLYYQQTENTEGLQDLLKQIATDSLRWRIVHWLIQKPDQHIFLKDYLTKIINSVHELHQEKLMAARYLMQQNDLEGLKFASNVIKENSNPHTDFRDQFYSISSIKDAQAIPVLIDLLAIAKQPEFQKDRFNSLDALLSDAFYNIGIQSEENFITVKAALENFIEENKEKFPHLNFMFNNIKRIEQQLYLNKSQAITIADAIADFKNIADS